MTIDAAVDPIPRDRYSRPLVVPPNGGKPVAYTRVTTLAGTLEDRFNLERWKMRQVAVGLSLRPDLQALVAANRDDKDTLNKVTEQATEAAAASGRANFGTALHQFAEMVDRGQPLVSVPPEIVRDIEAYQRATEKLEMLAIERFTVCDMLKAAGTPDRVARFNGETFIADLKTGDSIELAQGAIAIQLAVYSRSVYYDHAGAVRTPMPDVSQERALVIHMPAGGGKVQLQWVNLARGWDAALTADWTRDYRKDKLLTPADDLNGGDAVIVGLVERITAALTVKELESLYFTHQSEWTQTHTERAAARKAQLVGVA